MKIKGRRGDLRFAVVGTIILVMVGLLNPIVASAAATRSHEPGVVLAVSSCHGGRYQIPHVIIYSNGCQPLFVTSYYTSSSDTWNGSGGYNFSFELPWIAEVNPTGSIVALASLLNPARTSLATIPTLGGQKIDFQATANVTRSSGQWSSSGLASWNDSGARLGNVSATVVFHLLNATVKSVSNSSYSLKFDIGLSGWPWQNSGDKLGAALTSLSASGAGFSYSQSTSTLTQAWNLSGAPISSLVFGSAATVSTPTGANATATVSESVSASSPQAIALLEFKTNASAYGALSYDPWINFPSTSLGGGSAPISWLSVFTPLFVGSITSAALVSILLGRFALRRRRTPLEQGLQTI